jgi:hypothetical protein
MTRHFIISCATISFSMRALLNEISFQCLNGIYVTLKCKIFIGLNTSIHDVGACISQPATPADSPQSTYRRSWQQAHKVFTWTSLSACPRELRPGRRGQPRPSLFLFSILEEYSIAHKILVQFLFWFTKISPDSSLGKVVGYWAIRRGFR